MIPTKVQRYTILENWSAAATPAPFQESEETTLTAVYRVAVDVRMPLLICGRLGREGSDFEVYLKVRSIIIGSYPP